MFKFKPKIILNKNFYYENHKYLKLGKNNEETCTLTNKYQFGWILWLLKTRFLDEVIAIFNEKELNILSEIVIKYLTDGNTKITPEMRSIVSKIGLTEDDKEYLFKVAGIKLY